MPRTLPNRPNNAGAKATTEPPALDVLPTAGPPRLLRIKEVINRCGISRTTINRLIERAQFPAPISFENVGHRVVFNEREINEWIERQCARQPADPRSRLRGRPRGNSEVRP